MSDRGKTCWYTEQTCQACGGQVATNGRDSWCTQCGMDKDAPSCQERAADHAQGGGK
jgi:hypothetical protein